MTRVILALILMMAAQHADAVHCDGKPIGPPCDPGIVGAEKKKEILDLIRAANKMEKDVKKYEARYLAVRRDSSISPEKRLAALELYRAKKLEQDNLYKEALDKTQKLYRVGPAQSNLTIGQPADADLNYMENLSAEWNPQPARFDKLGRFGVKILGSDNHSHYGGVVREAEFGDITQGATFEDGRVFIFKELFDQALEFKNPGYLAQQLYHESRHFDQLSRPSVDGSGVSRSWASIEEDERDAYKAVLDEASTFGLDAEDRKSLDGKWYRYNLFVENNRLTRRRVDPRREALRKEFYEKVQVNLEEEYESLQKDVRNSRLDLEERQKLDREERERGAQAEQAALTRIGTWAEWEAAVAQCGYRLDLRSREDRKIIGFKNSSSLHYFESDLPTPSLNSLKIILLLSRTCDEIRQQPAPTGVPACNEAVSSLSAPMSSDLRGHLKYANSTMNAACIDAFLADAPKIKDSRTFEKSVAAYLKRLKKERADQSKRDRSDRERSKPRQEDRRRPPDDDRGPRESPDHDEVWRRILR